MSALVPVTPLSDPRRTMPADPASRRAVAEAAVNSLTVEMRRLVLAREEWPLARAAHQLRYWRFVRALCALGLERPESSRRAA